MAGNDWLASEKSAVEASIETFTRSLIEKDFATEAEYWTEDGALMPPGQPRVDGREQILGFLQANYDDAVSITHSNWRIEGSGGLAVVTNDTVWSAEGRPGIAGKQMLLLHKQGDGRWVRKAVIYNYDSAG